MPELTIIAPPAPNASAPHALQGFGATEKMDTDAAAPTAGSDFAAILGRQMAHSLPDAEGKSCRNAALPKGNGNGDSDAKASDPQIDLTALPGLSALLPALAALTPPPATTAAAPASDRGGASMTPATDALAVLAPATGGAVSTREPPTTTLPLPSSAIAGTDNDKASGSTEKIADALPAAPAGFAATAAQTAEAAADKVAVAPTSLATLSQQPQPQSQTPSPSTRVSAESVTTVDREGPPQDVGAEISATSAAPAAPIHATTQPPQMSFHVSAESAAPATRERPPQDAVAELFSTPSAAQIHAAAPSQSHAATSTATAQLDTPVGAPGWSQEIAQKVVWLAGRDESRAELTLNPPHLGRIEVTLTMSGDQTNALFVSASPTVRDALENALPRLRETLADAGITLGQASVNADSSPNGNGGNEAPAGRRSETAPSRNMTAQISWPNTGNGLIDTFV